MLTQGWTPIRRYNKKKYVWFEDTATERKTLKSFCRYPFLLSPKRENRIEVAAA